MNRLSQYWTPRPGSLPRACFRSRRWHARCVTLLYAATPESPAPSQDAGAPYGSSPFSEGRREINSGWIVRTRLTIPSSSRSQTASGDSPTPAQALSLVTEALSELVQLVPVFAAMLAEVRPPAPEKSTAEQHEETADRALGATQAAAILGVSPQWLYRHTRTLPFARKLSRKKTVYSEAGIRRWLEMRRPAA